MVILVTVFVGDAHAACDKDARKQHYRSECLEVEYKNYDNIWKKNKVTGRNICWEYGKVVAKIDLMSWKDRTWHLETYKQREWNGDANIRGVYCCEDLSDLCNISDIVDADSCLERFAQSPAANKCDPPKVTVFGGDQCKFTTSCDTHIFRTSLIVKWIDVPDNLYSCYPGLLQLGPCL
ncbi:MAG: hypothetical protein ERJ67_03805 [Aphanocapsa feldmannii 277cV]|uniref:Uncharacterized protein n=1 Tax=Aphanocapsa feldmannii 277cV TaxID=2507553 RepID=A0A524RPL6_9CHRO|nr:MAG: hypothetical protein ERJ67_03805 [Aphanocapsa feldmannii 277cV]